MITWIKKMHSKFIEDCRYWWKMWSSWLAIIWGCIVTLFWNDPALLGQLTNVMPPEVRVLLSPLVLAFVAGLPIIVRLLKQQKLEQAIKDGTVNKKEKE